MRAVLGLLSVLVLTACRPQIAITAETTGSVSVRHSLRDNLPGGRVATEPSRELTPSQIVQLAKWFEAHPNGWSWDPFVPYVPYTYVVLNHDERRIGTVNIQPGPGAAGVIVGDAHEQYYRQCTAAERSELLSAIGLAADVPLMLKPSPASETEE